MNDLRTNQGPLTAQFSPPNPQLPIVTEVIEMNGKPGAEALRETGAVGSSNLADVLHFADWGSVHRAFDAIGDVMGAQPETRGIVRIMRKADGEVLHVVHLNAMDLDGAQIEAVKKLLHYSWRDIDYTYDRLTTKEKSILTLQQFASIVYWLDEK